MTAEPQRIVILGAASAIAEATARIWAARGAQLMLVGRQEERLAAIAADLKVRGSPNVLVRSLDCAAADPQAELAGMTKALGGLDIVLLAYGVLGDQHEGERNWAAAGQLIDTNFRSAVGWCLAAAAILESRRAGALLVLGSVAGDRGRRSNYIYGASKAGLCCLVEGLAHRLAPSGARAVVIKPGFVDTPMTARMAKKGPLWSDPAKIAAVIAKAGDRGGPVVYAPAFWRLIMLVIRHLPVVIFNKLNI